MSNKVKFGSLWVGNPMSMIQKISMSSFVYHKQDIVLYVYDMNMPVPIGIKKVDANEIIPEDEIFLSEGSYAAFSDLFRYKMIKKTGRVWVDADTICLRDDWNFEENIFASYEIHYGKPVVVGGVLSLNKDSEILDYLIKESYSFDKDSIKWGDIGPKLLNDAFIKFDYMKYARPANVFLGIEPRHVSYLWEPGKRHKIAELQKSGTYSISVYNQEATFRKYDKNNFDSRSALYYFQNKFYIGEQI